MLSDLILPSGARPGRPRPAGPLRQPTVWTGAITSVDVRKVFWLPLSMPATASFLMAHRPAGMSWAGIGDASDRGGTTEAYVSYSPRSLPAGVSGAQLVTAIVAGPDGGSLLRADAQVIWYPPRSAVEHIDPAAVRSVAIKVTLLNPKVHTVARVITSRAVIAKLASLLNGMHATGSQPWSCPMIDASYQVKFAASAGARPGVVVNPSGCATDQITVGGTTQPLLWDPAARLIAAVHRLLPLSRNSW